MLIRNAGQSVVDGLHPTCSQITVRVKSIEMRMNGRVFPLIFAGNADSAVNRRTDYRLRKLVELGGQVEDI